MENAESAGVLHGELAALRPQSTQGHDVNSAREGESGVATCYHSEEVGFGDHARIFEAEKVGLGAGNNRIRFAEFDFDTRR